jgi:hypothetical protein
MYDANASIFERLFNDVAHEFNQEEIDYIEKNGSTIEKVRTALGKVPPHRLGEGMTLETLIGEANSQDAQDPNAVEPNVIDPSDPRNEGKTGADTANE